MIKMIKKIFIEGMSCDHCVARVKSALNAIEGVITVKVNLEEKFAQIDSNIDIENKRIFDVIDEVGYEVISVE
ncbi:MAG: heavy-metal-associated domain-containing protein [Eubacteriaceae bacterium]